jgi:hypothetical protein
VRISRRAVVNNGIRTFIDDTSDMSVGNVDGSTSAQVHVAIDENNGTYDMSATWTDVPGKLHDTNCIRGKCTDSDRSFSALVAWGLPLPDRRKADRLESHLWLEDL